MQEDKFKIRPRHSFAVCAYGESPYLEACLKSLKAQTARDFTTLIIDNGSTDGSAEWLRAYEKQEARIRVIFLPENTGFSGAVNLGIREADTPYVILLNNDVIADPSYVEELERMISRSGQEENMVPPKCSLTAVKRAKSSTQECSFLKASSWGFSFSADCSKHRRSSIVLFFRTDS